MNPTLLKNKVPTYSLSLLTFSYILSSSDTNIKKKTEAIEIEEEVGERVKILTV